eukprot:362502-Chlamydomonas_euryale.AAC.3
MPQPAGEQLRRPVDAAAALGAQALQLATGTDVLPAAMERFHGLEASMQKRKGWQAWARAAPHPVCTAAVLAC